MTANELIEIRQKKWNKTHDIEYDKRLRAGIANELVTNKELLTEVKKNPEKLIELVFVVVDKEQKTMPFFLNEVQKDFVDVINKAKEDYSNGLISDISILVLKGRQQGFTTFVTAYQLANSILNRNFQGFTLADKSDNAEAIFQNKAKFPHSQLPYQLKPTEKFNNRKQLLFEKINSSWAVDTATKDVGRSRTVNFFHGSECAFWKDGIQPIQAGLGEAFTKNCIKIYESTANGYNDYHTMWESGSYINCFYEWWRTSEYQIPFVDEVSKQEFARKIDTETSWIYKRLKWLKEEKQLRLEQLHWYYEKYDKYIDKRLIRQEYPCSPEEAFLLSGETVFDTEKIQERLKHIPNPLKVGYFTYDYDGLHISNIKWINDKNGYIKIYKVPNVPEQTLYCIGGDTAGEGSDYFTAHVLDAKTGEQVATLKHQLDADLYTKQVYCLGKYYSTRNIHGRYIDALISIESNFDSFPIRELQRLGYTRQYSRTRIDDNTKQPQRSFGFKTTVLTRPTIISNLIEIVREETDKINDRDTLMEIMTIVRNEQGRIEAPEGGHDDQMMGLAIAHDARSQVNFNKETIEITPRNTFGQHYQKSDYGERIDVI